jgi:hypothetical protein
MQRALDAQDDWYGVMKENGYHKMIVFGDTDNYHTSVSMSLHQHTPTKHLYVDVWGQDYCLAEFFVEPLFCAAFIVDKLPSLVHGYGLQDDNPLVGEMKLLRKAFAAFVRHEHGTHVLDEEGDETLEERQARNERWRLRQKRDEEAKKAALSPGSVP